VALYVFLSEKVRDQFKQHAHVFGLQTLERGAT
jgi:hypothetical protein